MSNSILAQQHIYFANDIAPALLKHVKKLQPQSAVIICDSNTYKHCVPTATTLLKGFCRVLIFKFRAGEAHKNFDTLLRILSFFNKHNIARNDVIINIGGGVVTDVGGFAASVFKRGLPYINVPTSLMSMTDAAIGGKTAINLHHIKNNIGTFYLPQAIIIHLPFLHTLPHIHIHNGFAEAIKHAIIASPTLFRHLQLITPHQFACSLPLIKQSITIKSKHVAHDLHDHGMRQHLNFGHTIGHAIEAASLLTKYPLLHGHAILVGMWYESFFALQLALLTPSHFHKIEQLLYKYMPRHHTKHYPPSMWAPLIVHDKKNGATLQMPLPTRIGKCTLHKTQVATIISMATALHTQFVGKR